MIKKITITIEPDGLQLVPEHLKKPDKVTLEIDKEIQPMEAIKLIAATLSSLINAFESQIKSSEKNNTGNTIN